MTLDVSGRGREFPNKEPYPKARGLTMAGIAANPAGTGCVPYAEDNSVSGFGKRMPFRAMSLFSAPAALLRRDCPPAPTEGITFDVRFIFPLRGVVL